MSPVTSITVEAAIPGRHRRAGPGRSCRKPIPDVAIGSYPFYREGTAQPFGAQLVMRGRDADAVEAAAAALEAMLRELGAAPQRVN